MSMQDLRSKLAAHHRQAKQQRDLYRAIEKAPTLASRQELQNLIR